MVQQWVTTMAMNDKLWRECIKTAWLVAPKIAVHVALRFQEVAVLWKEVAHLIRTYPILICDEPQALRCVTFFVSSNEKGASLWNNLGAVHRKQRNYRKRTMTQTLQ